MLTKPSPDITDLVNFLKSELSIAEATAVDVTFVDEDVMAKLHMRYMGLPGSTDVLSFPATDIANVLVDPTSLQDQPMLGDVVICPALVARNSQSQPTQMNIDACVIHAMLHLMGHDHQTAADAKIMFEKEEALMLSWQKSKYCKP